MDRLRPRKRKTPSEFTNSEVHKLEYYLKELGEKSLNQKFCSKIADALSRSVGRAGKPRVTWDEIQRWLQDKHQELMGKAKCISAQPQQDIMLPDGDGCKPMNFQEQCITIGVPSSPELNEDSHGPVEVQEQCIPISTQVPSSIQFNGSTCQTDASPDLVVNADANTGMKAHEQSSSQVPSCSQIKECSHFHKVDEPFMAHPDACIPSRASDTDKFRKVEKCSDLSEVEFEARSSKDEAWYDVERILTHRILSSGEAEVRVRYVGYGAEEDEWVNVKKSVRQRSLPIEHWECYRVKAGDLVLCFQEREDQAIYYDAHVLEVQRRMHDIRGCRCIFLVHYDHDKSEEKVRLRRLCRRP